MTRVPISLEVRCLRIATKWEVQKYNFSDYRLLVPEVTPDVSRREGRRLERMMVSIEDPWALRNEFLRMKHDVGAALSFLNQVGVFRAVADKNGSKSLGGRLMAGAFGSRLFFGSALPLTLEDLWTDQANWKNLFVNRKTLQSIF